MKKTDNLEQTSLLADEIMESLLDDISPEGAGNSDENQMNENSLDVDPFGVLDVGENASAVEGAGNSDENQTNENSLDVDPFGVLDVGENASAVEGAGNSDENQMNENSLDVDPFGVLDLGESASAVEGAENDEPTMFQQIRENHTDKEVVDNEAVGNEVVGNEAVDSEATEVHICEKVEQDDGFSLQNKQEENLYSLDVEEEDETKATPLSSTLEPVAFEKIKTEENSDESTQVAVQSVGGGASDDQVQVSYGIDSLSTSETEKFSGEVGLVQAENLKAAQQKIIELEKEADRLIIENEDLAAAGETFRKNSDEKMGELEKLKQYLGNQEEIFSAEMGILKEAVNHKTREIEEKKSKVEELECRLSSDLKKIRVRERELENRIELMKLENHAVVRQKDETLMGLKRKMDQLLGESNNYRNKVQELNKQIDKNQEQFRRTVKALRLALTNLEVDEGAVLEFKKVAK